MFQKLLQKFYQVSKTYSSKIFQTFASEFIISCLYFTTVIVFVGDFFCKFYLLNQEK